MSSICLLGRQPAVGLAELESLYGPSVVKPLSGAALLDIDSKDVNFDRLGGTVKLAKLLTTLNTTEWSDILKYLIDTLPQHLRYIPEGKIRFGLSVYGLPVKPATLNRSGLAIKKVIKSNSRSVRIVPNTSQELNTAQVIHNQLVGTTGMELVLIRHGKQTILGQTVNVQNINAYAARDQARPKRDAKVGMLPPKLAQIIINLANPQPGATVLDPFCGTGVVLQESSLMGYNVYGTDLEQRMVEYTQANLEWLNITSVNKQIEQGDATSHTWEEPFTTIAAETYLGRPFSSTPSPQVLEEVMQDVDTIHRKFLKNVAKQTEPEFQMCIAVPAWKTASGFKHLRTLDSLEELGYTRQSFVHVSNKDLVYHRPEQIVGRELVVLIRK